MIEGIVRKSHSKNYADGKIKIEIWFRDKFEKHFPDKNNCRNPIKVIIEKDIYTMFFRKTPFNKYLWLSPTVYDENNTRIRMTDVVERHGFSKDDRVAFKKTGKVTYVIVK